MLASLALAAALTSSTAPALTAEAPRAASAPEIKELSRGQRGKVVLLNFWATWCPPCLVEFPEIVAIERSYRVQGLVVISVSADSSSTIDTNLLPFLEKHPADFPIYTMATDNVEEFMRVIDPEWTGDIPATFFIDRQGKVASKRFAAMTREEMEQVLEALLEKPEP